MMTSTNFVLNKTTALEMRHHLETKFNKILPGHIENVMVTFNQPQNPNEPIGTYFAKYIKWQVLAQPRTEFPQISLKHLTKYCTTSESTCLYPKVSG